MSTLTAAGRRQIRDYRRERISRKLREDATFIGVPAHQRDTLSELKLVGKDLYADIRQRGIILPDASINPSVAEHRQNAGAQLRFILAVTELNRTQSASNATIDLVSLMSGQPEASESLGQNPDEVAAAPADDPEPKRSSARLRHCCEKVPFSNTQQPGKNPHKTYPDCGKSLLQLIRLITWAITATPGYRPMNRITQRRLLH